MNTVNKFKEEQKKSIEMLKNLQNFLTKGDELGVEIEPSFYKKIETAISDANIEKLKIVLVGGFSEGKTSIAAAWLGRLDKKTMKISEQESSNEVSVYEISDSPVKLIDTPGLFGFKEQTNADSLAIEKYKDITRKHVSEAHIVLYVMNPKNPIKESHADELQWLLRDLNLLPRTVFVLSRFDEVADVEDEDDYQDNLKIKQQNIIDRLKEVIQLTANEEKNISIIAVSANPFNLGTEKWLQEENEFKKLSHIGLLQAATTGIMEKNGGLPAVIYETQKSVISDVIGKQMPTILEKNKKLISETQILENSQRRLKDNLSELGTSIVEAKRNLRRKIESYFSRLIMQISGCSPETLQDFVVREIGEEGCIINSKIQQYFDEAHSGVSVEIKRIDTQLTGELNHYNSTMASLGKQGIHFAVKNVKVTNTMIINGRNFLKLPIKFKPWGAVKLAKGLNMGLAGLGFALEMWDLHKQEEAQEKFNKGINSMADNFASQQKELLDMINHPDFESQFFPEYVDFMENKKEIDNKLLEHKKYQEEFAKWCSMGDTLAAEFKRLKAPIN